LMRRARRSPRLKALLSAVALAVAAVATVLLLSWAPSRGGTEEESASPDIFAPSAGSTTENVEGGAGPSSQMPPSPGTVKVVTGMNREGGTYMEIRFPSPPETGQGEDGSTAAPGEPEDIYCAWILDMEGTTMGLKGCWLELRPDGTVAVPPSYETLMSIASGGFSWQRGSPDFRAQVEIQVKVNPRQGLTVPLRLAFKGTVSEDLRQICGDFDAVSVGEPYAALRQGGSFRMSRAR